MVDLPFTEKDSIRYFSVNIEDKEFKWHYDEEDRVIMPLHETDWMFQFDNRLPIKIENEISIPKGIYHRLIKGSQDLQLKIIRL